MSTGTDISVVSSLLPPEPGFFIISETGVSYLVSSSSISLDVVDEQVRANASAVTTTLCIRFF